MAKTELFVTSVTIPNLTFGPHLVLHNSVSLLEIEGCYQQPEIAVIAVNPGSLLNTNMVREAFGQYWSSTDKGGNILYELAVSETHKGVTEQYFDNDKGAFGKAHPDAYDETTVDELINVTANILAN